MGAGETASVRPGLCCLFLRSKGGYMVIHREDFSPADAEVMDKAFVDSYHPYLGEKIAHRYALPDYVRTVVLGRT